LLNNLNQFSQIASNVNSNKLPLLNQYDLNNSVNNNNNFAESNINANSLNNFLLQNQKVKYKLIKKIIKIKEFLEKFFRF